MDSRFRIRAGVVSGPGDDLASMYALDVACFDEPFRFSMENLERYVTARGALTFVAEQAADPTAALAGCVVVQWYARTRSGYVVTLDVDARWRRCGLATALMETVEGAAMRLGARMMHLHVHTGNEHAIAFYVRRGYVRHTLEEDLYGSGLGAWTYAKVLGGRRY